MSQTTTDYIETDHSDMYYDLAKSLMLESCIAKGDKKYEIIECEFYEYGKDHKDLFVHRHPDQLLDNCWYFHRTSRKANAKYRGGTFKGLDITLGDDDTYFGILIRSVVNSDDETFINGPCKTVVELTDGTKIETFVNSMNSLDVDDEKNPFYLDTMDVPSKQEIYHGKRIGLNARDDEEKKPWQDIPYRFVRADAMLSKIKAKRSLQLYGNENPILRAFR